MEPLYMLLICFPAALVLSACGCGMAVLWPPMVWPAAHTTAARGRSGSSPA